MIVAGPRRTSSRRQLSNYLFVLPQLIFFVVFLAWPVVRGLQISLYDWRIMAVDQRFVGMANYLAILSDDTWWLALRTSFTFTALVMTLNTVLALLLAVTMKRDFAGRNFFRTVFYLPAVLSVTVVGVVAISVWDPRGGLMNYLTVEVLRAPSIQWWTPGSEVFILVLTTVWWTFGFPLLVFIAGLRAIPQSVYEAAVMDGASGWQSLIRITLPLLTPTILFVLATQFITHMQMFGQAYQLGSDQSQTVFVYMFTTTWKFFRFGYASAMGVVLTLIIIVGARVLFALLGKRFEY